MHQSDTKLLKNFTSSIVAFIFLMMYFPTRRRTHRRFRLNYSRSTVGINLSIDRRRFKIEILPVLQRLLRLIVIGIIVRA